MRRINFAMSEIRKAQLARLGELSPELQSRYDTKIAEVDAKFKAFDNALNGVAHQGSTEFLAEVMVSADFTYAIQEFVQRLALPGYTEMMFNFEPLVKPDTVVNYLPHNRYQNRGALDDLEVVGEKGAPRPGYVDDATKRVTQAWRWEKEFDFSHEALVNDDLGYFEDTARQMGIAARRTLGKYVSRFYTNATSIARLTGLGALYSQNGRLTTARVSEARMAFGQRTDSRGNPIEVEAVYLVYHRGLHDTAMQILESTQVAELATNAVNVVNFIPIKDPYMAGTAPNLPWYMFADYKASNVIPFVLARRSGVPGPMILRKKSDIEAITSMLGTGTPVAPIWGDFETGNIVLKVVDIWGTYVDGTEGNLFDYRGAYYSSGTAP